MGIFKSYLPCLVGVQNETRLHGSLEANDGLCRKTDVGDAPVVSRKEVRGKGDGSLSSKKFNKKTR